MVFLASPRSDMITGQLLNVDGGVMTGYGEDLRAVLKQLMEGTRTIEAERR